MAINTAASGSLLRTFAQLPGRIKWAVLFGVLMLAALAYWLGVQSTSDGTLPSSGPNPPAIFHASGVQPSGYTT